MTDRVAHLDVELIGAYLAGQLDASTVARVERHAASCPACAALLCEEARLEEALYLAAELAETRPRRAPFGTVLRSSLGAFASAAAMLLVLLPGQPELDRFSDIRDRSSVSFDRGNARTRFGLDSEYLSCLPPSEGEGATCDQPGVEALLTGNEPLLASATPGEELATWPEPGDPQRLCTPLDPRDDSLCRPVELP